MNFILYNLESSKICFLDVPKWAENPESLFKCVLRQYLTTSSKDIIDRIKRTHVNFLKRMTPSIPSPIIIAAIMHTKKVFLSKETSWESYRQSGAHKKQFLFFIDIENGQSQWLLDKEGFAPAHLSQTFDHCFRKDILAFFLRSLGSCFKDRLSFLSSTIWDEPNSDDSHCNVIIEGRKS